MRTIRASEIGSFLYCHRSWWYQGQGIESSNQEGLAEGTLFHRRHGRKVILSGLLRLLGWALLLAALVALVVAITLQALG